MGQRKESRDPFQSNRKEQNEERILSRTEYTYKSISNDKKKIKTQQVVVVLLQTDLLLVKISANCSN